MKIISIYSVALLYFIPSSISHRNYFGFPQIFHNSCRRPRCETVRCKSPQSLTCGFEVGTDRCNCCPYCLKGPGTPCAGPNNIEGNCAKGLVCIDAKLRPIPDIRGPYTPVGECEDRYSAGGSSFRPILPPPRNKCPKNCAAVSCIRPEGCEFGIGLGWCGCCSVCLNGPGKPCAGPNNKGGSCRKDLVCVDVKSNEIPKNWGPNTPFGKCERQSGGGENFPENFPSTPLPTDDVCPIPDCSRVRCQLPDNCQFGYATDECSCCPRCNKGLEDPCAGPNDVEGNCAENLVCVDTRQKTIPLKRGQHTPVGKCVVPYSPGKTLDGNDRNSCNPGNCAAVSCLRPSNCRFGIGENICSCCPVCAKGQGERCGGPFNEAGICSKRLKCVSIYGRVIPADGNGRNSIGNCQAIGN